MQVADYSALPAETDEPVVVSVIADDDDGVRRLRHATCLVAPNECSSASWSG